LSRPGSEDFACARGEAGPGGAIAQRIAPAKKPLLVIIDEDLIEETKVAAIRDKRKVSGLVEELLQGWLAGRKAMK
jgi:hypothetical protein